MNTGSLDRRIQFLRALPMDDGFQQRPGAFVAHGDPVFAAMPFIRHAERFASDAVGIDAGVRFRVRYSPFTAGITTADRVRYDGRDFAIDGIVEIGRRAGFEITASELRP